MAAEVCTCPIRPKMTYEQIKEEIILPRKMCTDAQGMRWMCPTLDKELRRADRERGYRKRQAKQMKKEGYAPDQIQKAQTQPRRTRGVVGVVVDLDITSL